MYECKSFLIFVLTFQMFLFATGQMFGRVIKWSSGGTKLILSNKRSSESFVIPSVNFLVTQQEIKYQLWTIKLKFKCLNQDQKEGRGVR